MLWLIVGIAIGGALALAALRPRLVETATVRRERDQFAADAARLEGRLESERAMAEDRFRALSAAALKSNNEQAALSVESVKESQNAYDIAKARFDAGAIDYLTLLETQRSLYQAQDSQIAINQGQLVAYVQLRKALGA